VRGLDAVAAATDVVEVGRTAVPGRRVAPPLSNGDFVAHVLAVGARPWDVAARLADLAAGIDVDVVAEAHREAA
jgi:hypothetical protein